MIEDIAVTQTIHNFTNINYIIPHVGGAFPSIADRLLKSFPAIYDSSMKIFQTRFFWDSAGPTYVHQVAGLLAYGIPASQLLFGTDFPYAPSFVQPGALAAIKNSIYVTNPEKQALFTTNAQNLFGKRLPSG
jgi:predicted TIM-barrel fold metal-dependent hydrolase